MNDSIGTEKQRTPDLSIPRCAAMWCTHITGPGKDYCAHHAAFEGRATWEEEETDRNPDRLTDLKVGNIARKQGHSGTKNFVTKNKG